MEKVWRRHKKSGNPFKNKIQTFPFQDFSILHKPKSMNCIKHKKTNNRKERKEQNIMIIILFL